MVEIPDDLDDECSQGVAGSRPFAPLGLPAVVCFRVLQLTEPLLGPAPRRVAAQPGGSGGAWPQASSRGRPNMGR